MILYKCTVERWRPSRPGRTSFEPDESPNISFSNDIFKLELALYRENAIKLAKASLRLIGSEPLLEV